MSVSLIDDLLGSGDAILKAVVTRGRDVVNVVHLGRRPNAWQRTALLWQDPVCRTEGCGRRVHLEVDHVRPWAASKVTVLGWLQWKCRPCHRRRTEHDLRDLAALRRSNAAARAG